MLHFQFVSFHPTRINLEWIKKVMHSSDDLDVAMNLLTEIFEETQVEGLEYPGTEVVSMPKYHFTRIQDDLRIRVDICNKTGSFIGYNFLGTIIVVNPLKKGNWMHYENWCDLYRCRSCGFTAGMNYCEELCETCSAKKFPAENDNTKMVCQKMSCPKEITRCPRCEYNGSEDVDGDLV